MNRAERRAHEKASRRVQVSTHWRRTVMATAAEAWRSERARIDATTIDESQQRDLATFAWATLDALPHGQATEIDLENLAVMVNISRLLAERGYGAEGLEAITEGQMAVLAIKQRFERLGHAVATGMELQSLRLAIDIHEQQLAMQPTTREMREVIADMRAAVRDGRVMTSEGDT